MGNQQLEQGLNVGSNESTETASVSSPSAASKHLDKHGAHTHDKESDAASKGAATPVAEEAPATA